MAIKDLKKKGSTVDYERIPGVGRGRRPGRSTAFLAAAAKNPDVWIGLTASNVFIPVGPKVARRASRPSRSRRRGAGIKTGPQGGDNIFLVRPLNDQTAREAHRVRVQGAEAQEDRHPRGQPAVRHRLDGAGRTRDPRSTRAARSSRRRPTAFARHRHHAAGARVQGRRRRRHRRVQLPEPVRRVRQADAAERR